MLIHKHTHTHPSAAPKGGTCLVTHTITHIHIHMHLRTHSDISNPKPLSLYKCMYMYASWSLYSAPPSPNYPMPNLSLSLTSRRYKEDCSTISERNRMIIFTQSSYYVSHANNTHTNTLHYTQTYTYTQAHTHEYILDLLCTHDELRRGKVKRLMIAQMPPHTTSFNWLKHQKVNIDVPCHNKAKFCTKKHGLKICH